MGPDGPIGIGIAWIFGSAFMLFIVFFVYSMGKMFHENQFKNYVDKTEKDKPKNRLDSVIIFSLIVIGLLALFVGGMNQ